MDDVILVICPNKVVDSEAKLECEVCLTSLNSDLSFPKVRKNVFEGIQAG
jgi:hypothetical protein